MEMGHVFKLGTLYSESIGVNYLDESGERHPCVMGCYGIGVERMVAAIIEANHDATRIISGRPQSLPTMSTWSC